MVPVSTLYDEYIDRPKLTEQKKTIWVYSSSPSRGVGKIIIIISEKFISLNGLHNFAKSLSKAKETKEVKISYLIRV